MDNISTTKPIHGYSTRLEKNSNKFATYSINNNTKTTKNTRKEPKTKKPCISNPPSPPS